MASLLYQSLIEDFLKLSKPNRLLANKMYYYPLFANSIDEVIVDTGFCSTSLDKQFLDEINNTNSYEYGDSDKETFIWVITNKQIYIVNEKWIYGFGISIESIKCTFGFNLTPTRGKLKISGKITSSTSENEEDIISKNKEIEFFIKGNNAGFHNIFNFVNFVNSVNMNFIREDNKGFGEIKKIQLYPIVENGLNEDDKLEKDFYLFWIIEEWKEILFAFVSPSLMGTGNKDSIWELMQYLKIFIEGNEAGFFYKEPFSINIFSNSERFPKYDAFWRLDEIIYDKNTQKEVVKTIWEKK